MQITYKIVSEDGSSCRLCPPGPKGPPGYPGEPGPVGDVVSWSFLNFHNLSLLFKSLSGGFLVSTLITKLVFRVPRDLRVTQDVKEILERWEVPEKRDRPEVWEPTAHVGHRESREYWDRR